MTTIAKLLTLTKFRAWAKKQPEDVEFNYCSNNECAIARYLRANGFEDVSVNGAAVSQPEFTFIPRSIIDRMDVMLQSPGTVFTYGYLVSCLSLRKAELTMTRWPKKAELA